MITSQQLSRFDCSGEKDFTIRIDAAFTLVEIMVATALLALILLLLLQISSYTLQATGRLHQQMDATQNVSSATDALSLDLSNVMIQNGLSVFVKQDANNNTQMVFLTQTRGPTSVSATDYRLMAVSYEVDSNQLVRRAAPITWSSSDLVSAAISSAATGTLSVVSDHVLRFQAVITLDNGQVVPLSSSGTWISASTASGQMLTGGYEFLNLYFYRRSTTAPKVRSLVFGVAALDDQSSQLPGALNAMGLLPSPVAGETPASVWLKSISSGVLNSLPKPVQSAIQVAQVTCSLH